MVSSLTGYRAPTGSPIELLEVAGTVIGRHDVGCREPPLGSLGRSQVNIPTIKESAVPTKPAPSEHLILEARHRGHSQRLMVVAGVVIAATVTAAALFATRQGSPSFLRGTFGTRGSVLATVPRCRGAESHAAVAAVLPAVTVSRAPHLQPDPGGLPNPMTVGASGRLASELPKYFPDQYAGISLSADNSIINVYETCSTPTMTRFATAIAPVGAARFRFVRNTARQLNEAFRDVEAEQPRLEGLGIKVAGWGTDVVTNVVQVQVVNLTRQQLAEVESIAPLGLLQVQGVTRAQVGVPI